MGRRALAAATAALIALAGLVATSPAAQALVQHQVFLESPAITVHTANGKAWQLSLTVYPGGDGSSDEVRETLLRSQSKPVPTTEYHDWFATFPSSGMTFDSGSGDATVTTPSSIAALTTLRLTFTATSRRHASCSSGSKTYFFGNLTGRVTLKTQLRAGGTVGAMHSGFPRGKAEIIDNANCVPASSRNACYTSMSYQANGGGLRTLWGVGGPHGFALLTHDLTLNNPAGAGRQDAFSTNSSHAPVFNPTKHTLQVWAADTGPFTGTGRFTGGTLSKSVGACTVKGVNHREHIRTYSNATFRNGANHPLVAHTSLVGALGVPRTTHTYYEFDTWS